MTDYMRDTEDSCIVNRRYNLEDRFIDAIDRVLGGRLLNWNRRAAYAGKCHNLLKSGMA